MSYATINQAIKLPSVLAQAMPEFMVLKHQQTGVLTGRLWVPAAWTKLPAYIAWKKSVEVITEKKYPVGERLWFSAPFSEYKRLFSLYPHWTNAANNQTAQYLQECLTEYKEAFKFYSGCVETAEKIEAEITETLSSTLILASQTIQSALVLPLPEETKEEYKVQQQAQQPVESSVYIPTEKSLNKLTKPELKTLGSYLQPTPPVFKAKDTKVVMIEKIIAWYSK